MTYLTISAIIHKAQKYDILYLKLLNGSIYYMSRTKHYLIINIFIIVLLFLGLVGFFVFEVDGYFSIDVLNKNRRELAEFVKLNSYLSKLVFFMVYFIIVLFSVPGAAFMTIAGGFLFGWLTGGVIAIFAATFGATCLFIIARSLQIVLLENKARPFLDKLKSGFQKNAFNYLLFLRIIPLFPFWLVNIAPAFLGVSTITYMIATFFGIIPGTFIFALIGNGLIDIWESGEQNHLESIFEVKYILLLSGVAVLTIIPVICRKYKK